MEETTHFGFKNVKKSQKQTLVKGVFNSVASRYDLMNDVLSFGLHRLWKKQTIALSNVKQGDTVLDLAGGTGDLSKQLQEKVGADGQVILADINYAMLTQGRDKLLDNNACASDIPLIQSNAESLAFASESFDCVFIAFGLRNITDKQTAIDECYRVLKKSGRLLVLEFSQVQSKCLSQVYDYYSFKLMPKLGSLIADDADSYQYLAESIRKHPNQTALKEMVLSSGFQFCHYYNFANGIVALHKAVK